MSPTVLGGRYVLLQELGRGATAVVYRARDQELGVDVAVKVLAPHLSQEAGAVERLRRELLAARQITSEAVAQVYEFAEDADTKYVVMEYGPGGTLKDQVLLRGRLSPVQLDRLIEQLAEALAACHARGILHRDLKPSNILFDPPSGRIKLIDFGVARIGDAGASSATSGMVGTPEYMAPEQFDDSVPDPRSDLYAAGAVLYEAATGRPPISGRSVPEIARKHQQGAFERPRVLHAGLGQGAEALILRLLATDPADRFQTAEELLAAVAGRSLPPTGEAAPVAPASCPRCGARRESGLPFCPSCAASLDDFDRFGRWSVVVTASPDAERLRSCLDARLPAHAERRPRERWEPPLTVIEFASEAFARWLAEELRHFGAAANVRCLGLPSSLALAFAALSILGASAAMFFTGLAAPGPPPLAFALFPAAVGLVVAASAVWHVRRRFGRALAYVHPFPPRERASAPLARARLAQGRLRSARYRAIGRGLLVTAHRLMDFGARSPGAFPARLFEEALAGAYALLEAMELQSAALTSLAEPGETKALRRDALVRGTQTLLRLTSLWRREQAAVVRRASQALARRVARLEDSVQALKDQQAELRDVLLELQSLAPQRPSAP